MTMLPFRYLSGNCRLDHYLPTRRAYVDYLTVQAGIGSSAPFGAYAHDRFSPDWPEGNPAAAVRSDVGNRPVMVVPWPAWERTARVPPCAASRSDMPCRPEPCRAAAAGKPAPSSLTENSRAPPEPDRRMVAAVALACLATFCSASSAQK